MVTAAHHAALRLAAQVRDDDPARLHANLMQLDRERLASLALALADCVPVEQPKSVLLAWKARPAQPAPRPLEPCGTPAAAARHRVHREPIDDACRSAERHYSRDRKRAQRAAHSMREAA